MAKSLGTFGCLLRYGCSAKSLCKLYSSSVMKTPPQCDRSLLTSDREQNDFPSLGVCSRNADHRLDFVIVIHNDRHATPEFDVLRMPCDVSAADPPPSRRHRCSYSSDIHPCFLMIPRIFGSIGILSWSFKLALTALPTLHVSQQSSCRSSGRMPTPI